MTKALALKYRPQNFEDVVGQETAVRILRNILGGDKIHHAYLLTGPRGIGKTSLARIFAKALNCQKGEKPTVSPCGVCVSCQEITEGRSLSVFEIDGASNTSVDDVRELREKIRYLPPGGRYKIYIIDEVHMLSTAAFNALLKTVEEPPPHALFIFATTEPQKVPVTILSRCLHFDLRPIPIARIAERVREIAKKESIESDENALYEIAREATGGLRDALTLLDQASTYAGGKVTLETVEEILGASPRRFVLEIASSIVKQNSAGVMEGIGKAASGGVDPKRMGLELLEFFRHLLVVRVSQEPSLFNLPADEIAKIKEMSETVSENSLDQIFRMLQKGIGDLLRAQNPAILLDVLLLRLCHYKDLQSLDAILKRLDSVESQSPTVLSTPQSVPSVSLPKEPEKKVEATPRGWGDFLKDLQQKKPQLASVLDHSSSVEIGQKSVTLFFPSRSIHLEILRDRERVVQLEERLAQFFGRPLTVSLQERGEKEKSLVDEAVAIFQPASLKTIS